jgi:ribosomal protein L12E/L44/L45/RPP1/RPP2
MRKNQKEQARLLMEQQRVEDIQEFLENGRRAAAAAAAAKEEEEYGEEYGSDNESETIHSEEGIKGSSGAGIHNGFCIKWAEMN